MKSTGEGDYKRGCEEACGLLAMCHSATKAGFLSRGKAKRRILLLKSDLGLGIDVALAALPFEESATARALLTELTELTELEGGGAFQDG